MFFRILLILKFLFSMVKSDESSSDSITLVNPIILNHDETYNSSNSNEYLKSDKVNLTIGINLNGTDLILELVPNQNLININSFIERKSRNGSQKNYLSNKNVCLFYGKVKDFVNSFVSLSLCGKMNGYVYLNNSLFILEPFNSADSNFTHKFYLSENQIDSYFHVKNPKSQRSKKSVSIERTVETLIVADSSMAKRYQYLDLENYLLTIMNMVAFIYRDSSLESNINIVVVKILIFEEDEPFKVVRNASSTLESFCKYQKEINLPDTHPNHHDLAILITKTDICGQDNSCDTTGLANLGSICNPYKSCNINEDNGLSLAFNIAHEIGHNFNAEHDTVENECTNETSPFLMNTHLTHLKKNYIWSECSRKRINKFLDQADLECLDDRGDINLINNDLPLAGIFYDLDHQCKFSYGENATVCKNFENQCNEVWCQIRGNSVCLSKSERPADGTLCGDGQNYWCMNRECVLIEELKKPIDGGWGNWSEWSECNRQCNGGIQFIERKCNNPKPANGGKYCLGERRRYQICNFEKCNDTEANLKFKNEQCQRFNDVPYGSDNLKYEWEFHNYGGENPCKLFCKPKSDFFYTNFNENLDDGTPCSDFSNDVCLNGVCTPVGCDWILGSNTTYDSCGVCGGDDSSCNMYRGTVEVTFPVKGGYQPLFVLPKGARSIRIYEYSRPNLKNYLAIKNLNGTYYLNGQFSITVNTEFMIEGVRFSYTSKAKEDAIRSDGPLNQDLLIMLLLLSKDVSVSYFYTLPNNHVPEVKKYYTWEYTNDWSSCSKSCGKGFKKNSPKCMEIKEGIVDESYCSSLVRPHDLYEFCNLIECEPDWWAGDWQECSATCATSGYGYKKRSVLCVKQKPNQINEKIEIIPVLDKECLKEFKPNNIEECRINLDECKNEVYWIAEEWNRNCIIDLCSLETRVVKCSDINGLCDPMSRPISQRQCELPLDKKCGKWTTSQWSSCNKTCGEAFRSRKVECIEGNICNSFLKPHEIELCFNNPPCADINFKNSTQNDFIIADLLIKIKRNNSLRFSKRSLTDIEILNRTEILDNSSDFNFVNFTDDTLNNEIIISNETEIDENSIFYEKTIIGEDDYGFVLGNTSSMDYEWQVGEFGTCSRKCGFGIKSRKVECIYKLNHERVTEGKCRKEKPSTIEKCIIQECDPWNVTKWSDCMTTCGTGYQYRKVFCSHPEKLCDPDNVPSKKKACISRPCYEWRTDDWSECSATCGQGFKIRRVFCFNHMTNSTSDYCDKKDIPQTVQNCSVIDSCPIAKKNKEDCLDNLPKSLCRMIEYSNRCNESYLSEKCCKTCSKQNQKKTISRP